MIMPLMNGQEFMEEFKKHPVTIFPVPVYLCSASASLADSKTLGCRGFIKKPFDFTCLIEIVEKYCETQASWEEKQKQAPESRSL